MMLALLLAVAISSPELGTFFDLNGMVPDSVPSSRTFGSDDATNMTHRLDPQEQAAVNAVFEAYCERVYYGYAGLSNYWDEADWGPTDRGATKREFSFNPKAIYGRSPFYYVPDTNRVIETRRFVEYDNLHRICEVTGGEGAPSDFLLIERPTWLRRETSSPESSSASVEWSSSLLDDVPLLHGQAEDFPVRAWQQKTAFLGSDKWKWSNFCLSFRDLAYSYKDPVNWTPDHSRDDWRVYVPLERMMVYLSFGDPPHRNEMVHRGYLPNYGEELMTNTTMDVVGRGYAVTNVVEEHVRSYVKVGLGDPNPYGSPGPTMKSQLEESIAFYFYIAGLTPTNSFSGRVYFRSDSNPSYDVDGETVRVVYPYVNFDLEFLEGYYHNAGGIMFDSVDIACSGLHKESDINYVGAYPTGAASYPGYLFSYDADSRTATVDGDGEVASVEVWYDKSAVTYRAGLDGLTNETRRLISDNLVALGKGLSSLDRSYCEVGHAIPNVVSNFSGHASRRYDATFVAEFGTPSWDGENWTAPLVADIDIPALAEAGSSSTSVVEAVTRYDDYVCYANPAHLLFGVGTEVDPLSQTSGEVTWGEGDLIHFFGDIVREVSRGSGATICYCRLSPVYVDANGVIKMNVYVQNYAGTVYTNATVGVGDVKAETNVTLRCTASAGVNYDYGSTFKKYALDRREGYMPYPGDYSRADSSSLWTVMARGCRFGTGDDDEWYTLHSDESGRHMRKIEYVNSPYASQNFEYSSLVQKNIKSVGAAWSAADNNYARLTGDCDAMFASVAGGFSFDNPLGMLNQVSYGLTANDTLKNLVLKSSAKLQIGVAPLCGFEEDRVALHVFFNVDGDNVSLDTVQDYMGTRVTLPFPSYYMNVYLLDDTQVKRGHEPADYDFHGCGVAGRMTSLSRVDWNWSALRLERNNQ